MKIYNTIRGVHGISKNDPDQSSPSQTSLFYQRSSPKLFTVYIVTFYQHLLPFAITFLLESTCITLGNLSATNKSTESVELNLPKCWTLYPSWKPVKRNDNYRCKCAIKCNWIALSFPYSANKIVSFKKATIAIDIWGTKVETMASLRHFTLPKGIMDWWYIKQL